MGMNHLHVRTMLVGLWLLVVGCDTPSTTVVVDNNYPQYSSPSLVVYQAFWQAVAFTEAISPGASSEREDSVPASDNTAYALLAPGWDMATDRNGVSPNNLIVLQSKSGFALHVGDELRIPVDDAHFSGNCLAGSTLSQAQANFITQRVFVSVFGSRVYDAASCITAGDSF